MENKNKLLNEVTNFYIKSRDFNGAPISSLTFSVNRAIPFIKELVKDGLLSINYGDRHQNPHILAFEPESIEEQIEKVDTDKLMQACLYPTKKHLATVVKKNKYIGKPFVLMMALGEPQLAFKSFDLSVLENYRNDPRYLFNCNDINGSISIKSAFSENGAVYKRDAVFLQTFGFAYNKTLTKRAVAVYVRYLADLSPEHQQSWFNKILKGKYFIHPDYHKITMGCWSLNESIFNAFIEELHQINKMTILMGKTKLFKNEYNTETKPKNFGFLIRPTLKEFNDFTLLLDKLISDNLNKEFFKKDLLLETEESMKDGRIKVIQKATITLLEEWLDRVQFPNPDPKIEMIKTFREIRKLRQFPAHTLQEDLFDQKYIKKQRDLITKAYKAVRTLRLIFANHPKVKDYNEIPDWLFKGNVSNY